MLRATELAGFIGVGIARAAYVPLISHLSKERSARLSRVAFAARFAAVSSALSPAISQDAGSTSSRAWAPTLTITMVSPQLAMSSTRSTRRLA
jgi:hypothetical protein